MFGEQTSLSKLLEQDVIDDTFGYQFANEATYSYLCAVSDKHEQLSQHI